jgi:hypothetical protein
MLVSSMTKTEVECPRCHNVIDSLFEKVSETVSHRVNCHVDGYLTDCVRSATVHCGHVIHYECVLCKAVLFYRTQDAINFLQGKGVCDNEQD